MKAYILLLLALVGAQADAGDLPQIPAPVTEVRLSDASGLPAEFREAAAAVFAVLTTEGGHPSEYFVSCSRNSDGLIDVYIRHESHDVQKFRGWLGDGCGRCRETTYDPRTKKIGRLFGIR